MTAVTYPHIQRLDDGTLVIEGTRFKLLQIIIDHIQYGWDAVQIQRQHPQLSLGQIYMALAYYYDHEFEMKRLVEEHFCEDERVRREHPSKFTLAELNARKAKS